MLAYLVFVFFSIGRYLTMTLTQLERRLRLVEARNHGTDYVAIQDALDAQEDSVKPAPITSPIVVTDTARRFVDESDSEYAARVYGT